MRTIKYFLICYILIPLIASILTFASLCFGITEYICFLTAPLITVIIFLMFKKRTDAGLAAKVNLIILIVLALILTAGIISTDGTLVSGLMAGSVFLLFPFLPIYFLLALMGRLDIFFVTVILTFLAAFLINAFFAREKKYKWITPIVSALLIICLIFSARLYNNRPEVRYKGHGFDYMNGYSSTDFTDYTVYAENSKLASLDGASSFTIEDPEEMPVLDGAEACYPVYAALARAVYKDIDIIEKEVADQMGNDYYGYNGKYVTFTNTLNAFDYLVAGGLNPSYSDHSVDMFFGAKPSASQLEYAESEGVELEITPIGKEAFVFFVEEDNPVTDLTSDQIRAIYHGDITNWSEVGGKNEEIVAFQRPTNSGSQTMMMYFMGDTSLKEPKTYEYFSSMEGVIKAVAEYTNEAGAIGYSFRYFLEGLNQEKGVRILKVDGIEPSLASIEDGSYPLTVSLCLVTRKNDSNPNVQKMIDYILSDEGQKLIRDTGYGSLN